MAVHLCTTPTFSSASKNLSDASSTSSSSSVSTPFFATSFLSSLAPFTSSALKPTSPSPSSKGVVRLHVRAASTRESFDVSSNCVTPVFRSSPQIKEGEENRKVVRVLFLSEGNVCRSVLAESIFEGLVRENGLEEELHCSSKAVRDYNVGELPDPRTLKMGKERGVVLKEEKIAEVISPAQDITAFDLIVVMDKFNAADILKEVSVFDTIDPSANYSSKVRLLGSFCKSRNVGDIDDPLYGNMGGPEELDLLGNAITDIEDSCAGLLAELLDIKSSLSDGRGFREGITEWLRGLETIEWMVPPMLQKR